MDKRTDRQTTGKRDGRQNGAKEVEEKKSKWGRKQEEGTEQTDLVNVVTERVGGEMHWPPQYSTGNNVSDTTVIEIHRGSSLLLTDLHFEMKVNFGRRRSSSEAPQ